MATPVVSPAAASVPEEPEEPDEPERTVAQTSRAAAQLTTSAAAKRTSAVCTDRLPSRTSTTAGTNNTRAIERTGRAGVRPAVRVAVPAASVAASLAAAPETRDVSPGAGAGSC